MWTWSIFGVRELHDNIKPRVDFSIDTEVRGILNEVVLKISYLNELDVSEPLMVSVSRRTEELRL